MSPKPSSKDGDLDGDMESHKNVFNSSLCFNDIIYKVWLEFIIQFKRQKAETKFCQNLKFLSAVVTLKIG